MPAMPEANTSLSINQDLSGRAWLVVPDVPRLQEGKVEKTKEGGEAVKRLLRRTLTAPPISQVEGRTVNGSRLTELARAAFIECRGCGGINTREEGDHGQPAFCTDCGSYHLRYHPAALPALIEPGDLHD